MSDDDLVEQGARNYKKLYVRCKELGIRLDDLEFEQLTEVLNGDRIVVIDRTSGEPEPMTAKLESLCQDVFKWWTHK